MLKSSEKYHSNLKKSNKSEKKNENKMTMSFKLPEFVDCNKLKHYSYCFEKSVDNPLQYSISYFEFDVKDPNEEKKEDKFKKVSSMFFSDNKQQSCNNTTSHSNNTSSTRGGGATTSSSNTNTGTTFSFSARSFINNLTKRTPAAAAPPAVAAPPPVAVPPPVAAPPADHATIATTYTEEDVAKLKKQMAHEMEEREEIMKVQFELQQKHHKDNLKKTYRTSRLKRSKWKSPTQKRRKL